MSAYKRAKAAPSARPSSPYHPGGRSSTVRPVPHSRPSTALHPAPPSHAPIPAQTFAPHRPGTPSRAARDAPPTPSHYDRPSTPGRSSAHHLARSANPPAVLQGTGPIPRIGAGGPNGSFDAGNNVGRPVPISQPVPSPGVGAVPMGSSYVGQAYGYGNGESGGVVARGNGYGERVVPHHPQPYHPQLDPYPPHPAQVEQHPGPYAHVSQQQHQSVGNGYYQSSTPGYQPYPQRSQQRELGPSQQHALSAMPNGAVAGFAGGVVGNSLRRPDPVGGPSVVEREAPRAGVGNGDAFARGEPHGQHGDARAVSQRKTGNNANQWMLVEQNMALRPPDQMAEYKRLLLDWFAKNIDAIDHQQLFSSTSSVWKERFYEAMLKIYCEYFSYSKKGSKRFGLSSGEAGSGADGRGGVRPGTPAHTGFQRPGTPSHAGFQKPRAPAPPPHANSPARAFPSTHVGDGDLQSHPPLPAPNGPALAASYGPPLVRPSAVKDDEDLPPSSAIQPLQSGQASLPPRESGRGIPFSMSFDYFPYREFGENSLVAERYRQFLKIRDHDLRHASQHRLGSLAMKAVSFLVHAYLGKHPGREVGCVLTGAFGSQARFAVAIFLDMYFRALKKSHRVLFLVPDSHSAHWDGVFRAVLPGDVTFQHLGAPPGIDGPMDTVALRADANIQGGSNWEGVLMMSPEVFELKCHDDSEAEQALVNPGADIVFLVGVHALRTIYPRVAQAIRRIRTPRRVALTCAPLANNLFEYWTALDFSNPGEFGTADEFAETYVKPIVAANAMNASPDARAAGRNMCAGLVNRLKRVCIPLVPEPVVSIHHQATVRINLDPSQGQVYVALAVHLMEQVKLGKLDIVFAAYLLQIATSDTFSVERAVSNIDEYELPKNRGPLAEALLSTKLLLGQGTGEERPSANVLRILENNLPRGAGYNPQTMYPSSKIDTIIQLVTTLCKRKESVVVFAATSEVRDAVNVALKSHAKDNPVVWPLICDVNLDAEDNLEALMTWQDRLQNGHGNVLVTSINSTSDHWEMAPWARVSGSGKSRFAPSDAECVSGVSTVILVDCTWSNACETQVHSRIRAASDSGIVVYSLVAVATCEERWCEQQDSTTHPKSEFPEFDASANGFLVDREIDPNSCEPVLNWNYEAMAAREKRPDHPVDAASSTFDSGPRGGTLGNLMKVFSPNETLGRFRALTVRQVDSLQFCRLAWVRANLMQSLSCNFDKHVEKGHQLWLHLQDEYNHSIGLAVWDGLERRPNRNGRQESEGYAAVHERDMQMTGFNKDGNAEMNVKVAIRTQWDMYRRVFMSKSAPQRESSRKRSPSHDLTASHSERRRKTSSGGWDDAVDAREARSASQVHREAARDSGGARRRSSNGDVLPNGAGRGQGRTKPAWVTRDGDSPRF